MLLSEDLLVPTGHLWSYHLNAGLAIGRIKICSVAPRDCGIGTPWHWAEPQVSLASSRKDLRKACLDMDGNLIKTIMIECHYRLALGLMVMPVD
jgi:hypothetical protein